MKKKDPDLEMPKDTDRLIPVRDFLPPPEVLFAPVEKVKVTIVLSKLSIDFFKREAKKRGTKYQKMIRTVVDRYVDHVSTLHPR